MITRATASTLLLSTLFVVCWSSGFVGAELAARADASTATLLAWRFVALAALVLVVVGWRPGSALRSPGAWWRQARVAALTQVLYLGLVFASVAHGVPGGTAALLASLQPLVVATVAGRLLGELTTRRQWTGLAVGIAGVAVVVSGDLETAGTPAWAFLLPVGAMLSLAAGTVLERRLDPPETLTDSITMQALVTAAAFVVLAAGTGGATPPADPQFWLAVGWLLVLASLGGYGIYLFLIRRRGATEVSTMLYLTPPTTMLWVFLMFGEPVPVLGLVGLAITLVGVGLAVGTRHPSRMNSSPAVRTADRSPTPDVSAV